MHRCGTDHVLRFAGGTRQIVIRFRAVVLNLAANQSGSTLGNTATLSYTGGTDQTSTAANITVVEPSVFTGKDASNDGSTWSASLVAGDYGNPLYSRVRLNNGSADLAANVNVATTADLANFTSGAGNPGQFTSVPNPLDGVTLTAGMRVLVKNQSTPSQNGIYTVGSTVTTIARSTDADTEAELYKGRMVKVGAGTAGSGQVFLLTSTVTTLNNDAVTWTATTAAGVGAFNVTLNDPLPAVFSGTITTVTPSGFGAATPPDANNFEIVGGVLRTKSGMSFGMPVGSSVDILLSGTLAAEISPGQALDNLVTTKWTSMNDGVATGENPAIQTIHNPTAGVERTGAEGFGGALNDYASLGSAQAISQSPSLIKTVIATSEAHTTSPNVTIGEIVRYRLVATIPEGTFPSFTLRDNLPDGDAFLDDGTAKIALVSLDGTGLTSDATISGSTVAASGDSSFTPTAVILPARITGGAGATANGTHAPDDFPSGEDVIFNLGNLTNARTDEANPEYVIIEFNALVLNAGAGATPAANDTAADSDLATYAGGEMLWRNAAGTITTRSVVADTTGLGTGNAYNLDFGANNSAIAATFSATSTDPDYAVTLGAGEKIRVSLDLRFTANPGAALNNTLRIGLYNDGGSHGSGSDTASTYDNDSGYFIALGTGTGTSQAWKESGANSTVFQGTELLQVGATTGTSTGIPNNTLPHKVVIELARDSLNNITTIQYSIDGGAFVTFTDSNPLVASTFHAIVFGTANNNDFRVDNVAVTKQGVLPNVGQALSGATTLATSAAVNVNAVEPDLQITKAVTSGATGDGGDLVAYTLTIKHAIGSGAKAFDLNLSDLLPTQLVNPVLTSATKNPGSANVSSSFAISGNTLSTVVTSGRSIDLDTEEILTIVLSCPRDNETATGGDADVITPGQTINNVANLTWTSLPGANGTSANPTDSTTTGTSGAGDGERDGSGGTNPYADAAIISATTAAYAPVLTKNIVETSEDFTPTPSVLAANATFGEIVRFRIEATLYEGQVNSLSLRDNLGPGLEFITGSARVGFVSSASGQVTSTTVSSGHLAALTAVPSVAITPTSATTASPATPVGFSHGTTLSFNLGDVVNRDNDVAAEYAVIEYDAVVRNENLRAAPTSIANDLFSDSDLTSGTGWKLVWGPASTTAATITVSSGELAVAPGGTNRPIAGTFAPASSTTADDYAVVLRPGESLSLSMTFRITGTIADTDNNVRFGFYNDGGTHADGADVPGTYNDDSGYFVALRSGSEGTATGSAFFREAGGNSPVLSGTGTASLSTFSAVTYRVPDTSPHTLVFGMSKSATDGQITLSVSADGGTAQTYAVPLGTTGARNYLANVFHGVAIGMSGDINFAVDNVLVTKLNPINATGRVNSFDVLTSTAPLRESGGVTVSLVDPLLTIAKAVTVNGVANGQGDAGDPFVYTITVAHPVGPTSDAFDLNLTDSLPTGFVPSSWSATRGGSALDSSTEEFYFQLVGQSFSTKAVSPGDRIDLTLAQTPLVVTINGTLANSVTAKQVYYNTANLTWTSLPGPNGTATSGLNPISGDAAGNRTLTTTPGASGESTGERDGSGGVNNYTGSATVNTTIRDTLLLAKALTATTHTVTGATTDNDLAIGEEATYQVLVTVEEGVTPDVTITDTVPAGLKYVAGTAVFRSVVDGVTATGFGGSHTAYANGVSLAAEDINDNTGTGNAGTLVFKLINVTAPGSPGLQTKTFVIEYRLLAQNIAANTTGQPRVNSAVAASTALGFTTPASTQTATIKEPLLGMTKTLVTVVTADTDAGDTVVYCQGCWMDYSCHHAKAVFIGRQAHRCSLSQRLRSMMW